MVLSGVFLSKRVSKLVRNLCDVILFFPTFPYFYPSLIVNKSVMDGTKKGSFASADLFCLVKYKTRWQQNVNRHYNNQKCNVILNS